MHTSFYSLFFRQRHTILETLTSQVYKTHLLYGAGPICGRSRTPLASSARDNDRLSFYVLAVFTETCLELRNSGARACMCVCVDTALDYYGRKKKGEEYRRRARGYCVTTRRRSAATTTARRPIGISPSLSADISSFSSALRRRQLHNPSLIAL